MLKELTGVVATRNEFSRVYLKATRVVNQLLMLLSSSCGSHWSRELNKKRNSRKGREHTAEWERPRANSPCDLSLKTKNTSIFLLCFFLWPAKQAHPSWQRSDDKDQSERFSPLSTRAFRPDLSYTSLYNFYFPTPNIPLCFPIHKYLHHTHWHSPTTIESFSYWCRMYALRASSLGELGIELKSDSGSKGSSSIAPCVPDT